MNTPEIFEVIKDGQSYAMTVDTLMLDLLYASYKESRTHAPTITPEQWKSIYPHIEILEARYQADTT